MTASTEARPAVPARAHLAGVAASAAFALAWLGLSWWHPSVTYHFGPPLAAAASPVLLRARVRGLMRAAPSASR